MSINLQDLSHDDASRSDMTPRIKIDKPLVVYRFLTLRNDVHYNAALKIVKSRQVHANYAIFKYFLWHMTK